MGKKKVRLQYIENSNNRKSCYKKRVKSIIKKAEELSILCAIEMCIVIFGPYSRAPVVWPPAEEEVRRILTNFSSRHHLNFNKFDQPTYLMQSIQKRNDQVARLQQKNADEESGQTARALLTGKPVEQVGFGEIDNLLWVLDDKMRSMQRQIFLKERAQNPSALNTNAESDTDLNTVPDAACNIGNESMGKGEDPVMAETSLPPPDLEAGSSRSNLDV